MHRANDGVQITVLARDRSRQITGGALVDFDDVLVPAADGHPAHTLRDALGAHAETAFTPVAEAAACDSMSPFIAADPALEE